MQKNNFIWSVGSVVVALTLAQLMFGGHTQNVGAITSPSTNLDFLQLSQGLQMPAGPSVSTTLWGSQIQAMFQGTCYLQAAATTIAASSTATVDCQASTIGANTALASGITAGSNVRVQFATTTPTLFQGLSILGASASSTPGFVTIKVFNGTGATFTWANNAGASTTQYWIVQ